MILTNFKYKFQSNYSYLSYSPLEFINWKMSITKYSMDDELSVWISSTLYI